MRVMSESLGLLVGTCNGQGIPPDFLKCVATYQVETDRRRWWYWLHPHTSRAGVLRPVCMGCSDQATGWSVTGSGKRISSKRPDRPWSPLSLLFNGYRWLFPQE